MNELESTLSELRDSLDKKSALLEEVKVAVKNERDNLKKREYELDAERNQVQGEKTAQQQQVLDAMR